MATHPVAASNTSMLRRRSAPEPILPGLSRRRPNDGTLTHTGLSPISPGSFDIGLHASCPRCHHWHDKFPIRLSRHPQAHTRVSCQRCSRPMFGLGGNFTRISLLSQETRTGSNLSQLSASIVCISRRPTMPEVPVDRSARGSYTTVLQAGSHRPSSVHSETRGSSGQPSPTGGPQTASSSEASLPDRIMPQSAAVPTDSRTTPPPSPKGSFRKRVKNFIKKVKLRVSNHYRTRSSPTNCHAASSQTTKGTGGTYSTRQNPFEGQQPTEDDQRDPVHREASPGRVGDPTQPTTANVTRSAENTSDVPVLGRCPRPPNMLGNDNNRESNAERIREIRHQKTETAKREAARRRPTCECSDACPCKQTCSSDPPRSAISPEEVPERRLVDTVYWFAESDSVAHRRSDDLGHIGAHSPDSPSFDVFTIDDANSSSSDAALTSDSWRHSRATTLHSSDTTSSERPGSSSSTPSQIIRSPRGPRLSQSLASLSRLRTEMSESAMQLVNHSSAIDEERTPTQGNHDESEIDGERTPTQDHHVDTRDHYIDRRDHSIDLRDYSADRQDRSAGTRDHPVGMQDHVDHRVDGSVN